MGLRREGREISNVSPELAEAVTFNVGRGTRFGEYALVVVISFVFLVLAALALVLGIAGFAELHEKASQIACLAGGGGIALLFIWLGWRFACQRLRFAIEISTQRISFGRPPFGAVVVPEDVVMIRARAENQVSARGVEVRGDGFRWDVFLGKEDTPACIAALRVVCTNATYIDLLGHEHVPERTQQPVRALHYLIKSRRYRGWSELLFGSVLALWSCTVWIQLGIAVIRGTFSHFIAEHRRELRVVAAVAFMGVMGAMLAFDGIRILWKARCMERELDVRAKQKYG